MVTIFYTFRNYYFTKKYWW